MALQSAYKQFLAAPNSAALAADASLHYVTTTTSFAGATEIIKHLSTQRNQIKKKKEEFLDVVEGQNAISAELETNLEFNSSGGAYLPGLDDNFLTDRIVYLSIVHFVSFDADGKIRQIRQSWDQGSLLKQLDIIGKTGRNWPIRDSKDQLDLITRCIKATGKTVAAAASAGGARGTEDIVVRSRGNSSNSSNSTNIMRNDPHTTLSLFGPREEMSTLPAAVVSPYAGNRPRQRSFAEILGDDPKEDDAAAAAAATAAVVSPYAGSRPRQRSFTEILGDDPEEDDAAAATTAASPTKSRARSRSPTKAIAPKSGAGKNFQPSRLFDTGEEALAPAPDTPDKDGKSPDRFYRPNPKKYQHFDFADGTAPEDAPLASAPIDTKSKHGSNWTFDDFNTPSKPVAPRALPRAQEVRHWGTENDEVPDSPAKKVAPPKPRRDAEAHFEFLDDGLPGTESRAARPVRGASHNKGLGLYENNLYNEDGSAPTPDAARALGNITNLKGRQHTFGAHFEVTDDSPQQQAGGNSTGGGAQGAKPADAAAPKLGDDRAKAVRMMESSWDAYDESPASQKENSNPGAAANGRGTARSAGREAANQTIAIAGDGMGGKKGTGGRGWGIGDDSDEERAGKKSVPNKKLGATVTSGNFWDFD